MALDIKVLRASEVYLNMVEVPSELMVEAAASLP
jgi:hypothetical protein